MVKDALQIVALILIVSALIMVMAAVEAAGLFEFSQFFDMES